MQLVRRKLILITFLSVLSGILILGGIYYFLKVSSLRQPEIRQPAIVVNGFSEQESVLIIRAFNEKYHINYANPGYSYRIQVKKVSDTEAIINLDVYCSGLCGGGSTYKAKKIDGQWTVEFVKTRWVS